LSVIFVNENTDRLISGFDDPRQNFIPAADPYSRKIFHRDL